MNAKKFTQLVWSINLFVLSSFGMYWMVTQLFPIHPHRGDPKPRVPTIVLSQPTLTSTLLPSPTPTATTQVALVEIVPDTPAPQVYVGEVIVYQEPVQQVEIVPTQDVSQWIIPLNSETSAPIAEVYVEQSTLIPDIDQVWDSYATPGSTPFVPATSSDTCVFPLPQPYVTWDMALRLSALETDYGTKDYEAVEIRASDIAAIAAEGGGYFPSEGVVYIQEGEVTSILIKLMFDGRISKCTDSNGMPNAYNVGEFLTILQTNYLYAE